jgi:transcriptional regulator with XRE-family HTH domain
MQAQDMPRDLGRAVREARRQRGMTQETLALETGLGRKSVWQIESGRREPRVGTLYRIAGVLDVSVAALLAAAEEQVR